MRTNMNEVQLWLSVKSIWAEPETRTPSRRCKAGRCSKIAIKPVLLPVSVQAKREKENKMLSKNGISFMLLHHNKRKASGVSAASLF